MDDCRIRCPATGAVLEPHLSADHKWLAGRWNHSYEMNCPHCGKRHLVPVRHAFIAQTLNNPPWGSVLLERNKNRR